MITTLLLLCAQTPVQHELDMIPFEHLINHKSEAEKMHQNRMALDLLVMASDGLLAPPLRAESSFDQQLASSLFNIGMQGVASGMDGEREFLPMPTIGSLFGGQNSHGPFHGSTDILNSIMTYMEPAFDDQREGLKIDRTSNGRVLLAYLQPSQSEWIHDFVVLQEDTETWTALVDAHIFVGGSEWLDANGFENQTTPVTGTSTLEGIVEGMRSAAQEEVSNPQILTNPGMEGSFSLLTEFSYVDKWEEQTVQPSNVSVLDPSIETVEEGIALDVRVIQVADNQYGIEISYELLDLIQPMEIQEVMLGGVSCMTASPEVIATSLKSNLVIPDGGGAVYRTTRASDQKEIVLVLQFNRIENMVER